MNCLFRATVCAFALSLRHVTSRHVTFTSRHVTSRHVTSRHVTSRHFPARSFAFLVSVNNHAWIGSVAWMSVPLLWCGILCFPIRSTSIAPTLLKWQSCRRLYLRCRNPLALHNYYCVLLILYCYFPSQHTNTIYRYCLLLLSFSSSPSSSSSSSLLLLQPLLLLQYAALSLPTTYYWCSRYTAITYLELI